MMNKQQQGDGFFQDLVTKPISTIGGFVLPAIGGTLGGIAGGLAGTATLPIVGTVSGGAIGSAAGGLAGTELNEYLKSQGLGKRKRHKKIKGGAYTFGVSQVGAGTGHASYLGNNMPTAYQTALPGYVFGMNGVYYKNPSLLRQAGSGVGEYNVVSSSFGRVQM